MAVQKITWRCQGIKHNTNSIQCSTQCFRAAAVAQQNILNEMSVSRAGGMALLSKGLVGPFIQIMIS